jgi:tetratricopeptide (TPR) repeat protein
MKLRANILKRLLVLACCGSALSAHAQLIRSKTAEELECGTMVVAKRVEPMDYRTDRKMLSTVEGGHFQPQVEDLIQPMFDSFGADLDYTLHAYPNHHRALLTLIRLGERERTDEPKGTRYTIDCYLRRAIRWRSDDLIARMIYAQYLIKKNRLQDARAQLGYVGTKAGDNPFTHFNLGLSYFDMKAYDEALEQAHLAAALGMENEKLKNKLIEVGQWREPVVGPDGAASAVSATSEGAASSASR